MQGIESGRQPSKADIKRYLQNKFNLPEAQVDLMLPDFIVTLSDHMHNIQSAYGSGDLVWLGRAAHAMKGALLNLGLSQAAAVALIIEENGRDQNQNADFQSHISQLQDRIANLFS